MVSNKQINITASLDGFLPCIGLQMLSYNPMINLHHYFYEKTTSSQYKIKKCPYCGMIFAARIYAKKKEQEFCSISCAKRYIAKNNDFKQKKLLYRVVDKKEFSKWFKKYNNIVIGYIYNNFDSEFVEDLIDIWTDKSIFWYQKILNKNIPFPFIKKNLFCYEKNLRSNKKEVFYNECNFKVQNLILGEIIDE